MLEDEFGFVDGLHLPVQAAGDAEVQNAYYSGWVHAHFTSNIFVFSPVGTKGFPTLHIILCTLLSRYSLSMSYIISIFLSTVYLMSVVPI
ncbi:uncharacterized protein V1513DRAFT_451433 [Lipomyces chichibuensis]|uniref:uncharacterized protein n=1 Tax=Lipomyces chichibuensis TaxID=1546026 RepID=UPI0033439BB0